MELDKFEGTDYIMIIALSNPIPKCPNHTVLVPSLRILTLAPSFALRQIRGHWFQLLQYYFQISAPKYP